MSAYLLDTHTLLWFLDAHPNLSKRAREIIEDPESNLSVSIVSLWEISIKVNLNKLSIDSDISQLEQDIQQLGISLLPILVPALDQYLQLPLHHRDPFDRLLISQAITMNKIVLSADSQFDAYAVERIW